MNQINFRRMVMAENYTKSRSYTKKKKKELGTNFGYKFIYKLDLLFCESHLGNLTLFPRNRPSSDT